MNLNNVLKALCVIAHNTHPLKYFNTVHIENRGDKCLLEASNGSIHLQVFCDLSYLKDLLPNVGDQVFLPAECLLDATWRDAHCTLAWSIYSDHQTDHQTDYVYHNYSPVRNRGDLNYPTNPLPPPSENNFVLFKDVELLMKAISLLREGSTKQGACIGTDGMLTMEGHHDDIEYRGSIAHVIN